MRASSRRGGWLVFLLPLIPALLIGYGGLTIWGKGNAAGISHGRATFYSDSEGHGYRESYVVGDKSSYERAQKDVLGYHDSGYSPEAGRNFAMGVAVLVYLFGCLWVYSNLNGLSRK